jgi:hypothetical protein
MARKSVSRLKPTTEEFICDEAGISEGVYFVLLAALPSLKRTREGEDTDVHLATCSYLQME